MNPESSVLLSNGVSIPWYGLGLSHNGGGDFEGAIDVSLQHGVRLYDTAARYGTESVVGDTLTKHLSRGTIKSRDEVFLTSKLWPGDFDNVKGAFSDTLSRLNVDVLDMYLVHWPGLWGGYCDPRQVKQKRQEVWREMELLLESGKCRCIGVSNFLERHLESLFDSCSIKPQVNQIELNPLQFPQALMTYCIDHDIQVEGYCPLAKGRVLRSRKIADIASVYQISPAQLCIAWSLQHGVITIPKSTSSTHIESNLEALELVGRISGDHMHALDSLHCDCRSTWNPTDVP